MINNVLFLSFADSCDGLFSSADPEEQVNIPFYIITLWQQSTNKKKCYLGRTPERHFKNQSEYKYLKNSVKIPFKKNILSNNINSFLKKNYLKSPISHYREDFHQQLI